MTAFRLDLPVSANDLVRPAFLSSLRCESCGNTPPKRPIVRLVSTAEAKAFREHAHRRLPVIPMSGPVEVYATFFVGTISQDVDNRLKSLLDACKGRLFHDDVQVAELHIVKVVTPDESKVGVVIEVRAANPAEHFELARRLASSSIQKRENEAAQPTLFTEPTGGGHGSYRAERPGHVPAKPPDAAGGGVGPVVPAAPRRGVVLPSGETLDQRINRIARPSFIDHREPDDDEPKGGAA